MLVSFCVERFVLLHFTTFIQVPVSITIHSLTVYRTYPLNDPNRLVTNRSTRKALPSAETVLSRGNSSTRLNDAELALQNLARLNVSSKGEFLYY